MEVVTVTCILCNGTVNFKNREPALFNAHMRDQHNTFYRIDYILASCFMQGQHLDKVEEEWAKMEREQRVEEVVEVDQNGEETNNGLNFENNSSRLQQRVNCKTEQDIKSMQKNRSSLKNPTGV